MTDRRTDGWTDGRTDGQTDGQRRLQYPDAFLKKRGDKDTAMFIIASPVDSSKLRLS